MMFDGMLHIDLYGFLNDCGCCARREVNRLKEAGVDLTTHEGQDVFREQLSASLLAPERHEEIMETAIWYAKTPGWG